MSWIAAQILYLAATWFTAADTACAEASHDWVEVDAVLQVAVNRVEALDQSLYTVLTMRRQFAHGCPRVRQNWRHLWAAARAMTGHLEVPAWFDGDVHFFCTPRMAHKWRECRQRAGRLRHVYWDRKPRSSCQAAKRRRHRKNAARKAARSAARETAAELEAAPDAKATPVDLTVPPTVIQTTTL